MMYRVRASQYNNMIVYHIERLWFGLLWLRNGDSSAMGFYSLADANKAAQELAQVNGGEVL